MKASSYVNISLSRFEVENLEKLKYLFDLQPKNYLVQYVEQRQNGSGSTSSGKTGWIGADVNDRCHFEVESFC